MRSELTFNGIVTIDGLPGAGKTTMAELISHEFKLTHLDSGAIFRTLTLYCMENNINFSSQAEIVSILPKVEIQLSHDGITLGNKDVSKEIRSPQVTGNVRFISHINEVRNFVSDFILAFSTKGKIVCDGRNTGTQVFPNAQVKFYMIADLEERAKRRYKDFLHSNSNMSFSEVYNSLAEREKYEIDNSILLMPQDAVVIDNTHMDINETFEVMKSYIK